MKQTILILIFSTFIFTGCGGNNTINGGTNNEIVGEDKVESVVTIDVNAS